MVLFSSNLVARPKSTKNKVPYVVLSVDPSNKFSGLRSRWTIPQSCITFNRSRVYIATTATFYKENLFPGILDKTTYKFGPRYCITKYANSLVADIANGFGKKGSKPVS